MYVSNCFIEAWKHWKLGHNREPEQEVYIWIRRSRYKWSPFHMGWGSLDTETGMLKLESFKPENPHHVPWWKSWTRIFFRGQIYSGDRHYNH